MWGNREGLTEPLLRGQGEEGQGPSGGGGGGSQVLSRTHSGRSSLLGSVAHKRMHVGADRGTGLYQLEREKLGLPSLVQAGRCEGRGGGAVCTLDRESTGRPRAGCQGTCALSTEPSVSQRLAGLGRSLGDPV